MFNWIQPAQELQLPQSRNSEIHRKSIIIVLPLEHTTSNIPSNALFVQMRTKRQTIARARIFPLLIKMWTLKSRPGNGGYKSFSTILKLRKVASSVVVRVEHQEYLREERKHFSWSNLKKFSKTIHYDGREFLRLSLPKTVGKQRLCKRLRNDKILWELDVSLRCFRHLNLCVMKFFYNSENIQWAIITKIFNIAIFLQLILKRP